MHETDIYKLLTQAMLKAQEMRRAAEVIGDDAMLCKAEAYEDAIFPCHRRIEELMEIDV